MSDITPEADRTDGIEPPGNSALIAEAQEQNKPPASDSDSSSGEKVTVRQPDGRMAEVELEPDEEVVELKTGDTLVSGFSGDVLLMPDGGKLAFSIIRPEGSLEAMDMMDRRLAVQSPDGSPLSVEFAATLTGMPPTAVYNLSDGSKLKVKAGIAELSMLDGTAVYMDEMGIFAVARGDKSEVLRSPSGSREIWDISQQLEKEVDA